MHVCAIWFFGRARWFHFTLTSSNSTDFLCECSSERPGRLCSHPHRIRKNIDCLPFHHGHPEVACRVKRVGHCRHAPVSHHQPATQQSVVPSAHHVHGRAADGARRQGRGCHHHTGWSSQWDILCRLYASRIYHNRDWAKAPAWACQGGPHPRPFRRRGAPGVCTLHKSSASIVTDAQGLEGHWESFRPGLLKLILSTKVHMVRGSPICVLTATITSVELEKVTWES